MFLHSAYLLATCVTWATATIFGMSLAPGTGFTLGAPETAAQQVARIVDTYGAFPVAKVFYSGALPASFNTNKEGRIPGKKAAVCFKYDQDALARGDHDATVRTYLDSIPAGWKILLVNWHEPDEEMWVPAKFRFTNGQHRKATEHLTQVVHAHPAYGEGRAEVWEIFMGYSLDVGRFDGAAVYKGIDGLGWDYYWNKPTYTWDIDPVPALDAMATKSKNQLRDSTNPQWGLFETGDNPHTNDPDGSGRARFWDKVYAAAQDRGYAYVVYFNLNGTTGDHRILPDQASGNKTAAVLRKYMTA